MGWDDVRGENVQWLMRQAQTNLLTGLHYHTAEGLTGWTCVGLFVRSLDPHRLHLHGHVGSHPEREEERGEIKQGGSASIRVYNLQCDLQDEREKRKGPNTKKKKPKGPTDRCGRGTGVHTSCHNRGSRSRFQNRAGWVGILTLRPLTGAAASGTCLVPFRSRAKQTNQDSPRLTNHRHLESRNYTTTTTATTTISSEITHPVDRSRVPYLAARRRENGLARTFGRGRRGEGGRKAVTADSKQERVRT